MYLPLIVWAYIELSDWAKQVLDNKPNTFILSMLKDQIVKGVAFRGQFIELKSEIEVYIGIYLVVALAIGWSNFISVIVYWQLLRIKHVLNYNTKAAFTKVDSKINLYLNKPWCPGILRMVYAKLKSVMGYFGSMDDPQ
jgi:hypothetical protein